MGGYVQTPFSIPVDYGWGGKVPPGRSLWVIGGSGGSSPRIPGWQPEDILGLPACNGSLMGSSPPCGPFL